MNSSPSQPGPADTPAAGSPGDPLKQQLEQQLADLGKSPARGLESELAASGSCPQPAEVVALQKGEIRDQQRRQALARHLLACPRCADPSLKVLLPQREARVRQLAKVVLPIAAAVLLAFLFFPDKAPTEPATELVGEVFVDCYLVDATGLVLRGPEGPATARRALVQVSQAAQLALLVEEQGLWRMEAVEGKELWVAAEPGEELLLPLDRAVDLRSPSRWAILGRSQELSAAETLQLMNSSSNLGTIPHLRLLQFDAP